MASGSSISAAARHYAEAAFAVARDERNFEGWQAAVEAAAHVLAQPNARALLTSPSVRAEEKRNAMDRLIPAAPPSARNFLHILVDRGRLGEIAGIAEAFRERLNRERGIVTAEVTTAVPIDPDTERVLTQRLGAFLQQDPQKLVIRQRVDPAIIGGVVARVGDTLIDDSVRGRLERLRRTLARAT